MNLTEREQRFLDAFTEAREEHEGLGELLDLHRDLWQVLFEAREEIPTEVEIPPRSTIQQHLREGVPQLTFDQLKVDRAVFEQLARQVAQVLLRYNPDLAEEEGDLEASEWLALAKEWYETPRWGDSQPRLPALAAAYALVPYLESAAEAIGPHINQIGWYRGRCPVCGGEPDFAFLEEEVGTRYLVCSRCSMEWLYKRLECPFCGNNDQKKLAYYPSQDGIYRLYVCEECRRYLKAIDLRRTSREIHFPIERVVTVSMDLAARQKGYE